MNTMTLKQAGGTGRGYVLYGNTGTPDAWKWLERWFASIDKAMAYAAKRGYIVVLKSQ
jgi:hypothetical protein